ncbi:hypothetical protein ACIG0D_01745 [Streptomyces sp. NPDC052773]|uniref:hypothetical protein n=1 Tax=Streptomyces sp. NPDC052773 TaxID=3365693 RepID=UPI0037D8EB5E
MAHTFDDLVNMQRTADEQHARVRQLQDEYGAPAQQEWTAEQTQAWNDAWTSWRDAADAVQAAVTEHAQEQGAARHQVEADVKKAARHPEPDGA